MFNARQPRFRIHRLDSPSAAHYQAFWEVEGRTFRVEVWDEETWRHMPASAQPPGAMRLAGPGWMLYRPLAKLRAKVRARTAR